MSTLHHRIRSVGANMAAAMASYHPWGTADTPQTMTLHVVTYTDTGATMQRATPLLTAGGALIPATAPGQWGQVHAAGRP